MIVYMGISGSGKGTQCELLAKQLGYTYLSMHDLIVTYADAQQQEKMRLGVLLDDAGAIGIAQAALNVQTDQQKIILDGFPRTPGQAAWLVNQAKQGPFRIEAVISLLLSEEKVLERLLARGRADDTPKAIKSRFDWYTTNVVPALDIFKHYQIRVYDIDASGTPEEVYNATLAQLRAAAIVS